MQIQSLIGSKLQVLFSNAAAVAEVHVLKTSAKQTTFVKAVYIVKCRTAAGSHRQVQTEMVSNYNIFTHHRMEMICCHHLHLSIKPMIGLNKCLIIQMH
jgi:hypothetical protein